jgi:polyphenol oxidase
MMTILTKVASRLFMSVTKPAFLYQTPLGGIATVSVTHNLGCLNQPYAGNLGLHVQDDTMRVSARRTALESSLGHPIQWLNQVHGTAVHHVTQATTAQVSIAANAAPTADAAITVLTGQALAIMTADCLPVMFSAHNANGDKAVGAAHAGWRGLLNGVLECTTKALHDAVPHAEIHAHLGPCIGVAQFEVGEEVKQAFIQHNPAAGRHFTYKALNKYWCDLESLARDSLRALGVRSITGGGWCTVSDPRLASYRRRTTTGRFATVVVLN